MKPGQRIIPWVGETGMRYPGAEQPLPKFLVVVFVFQHPTPADGLLGPFFWGDLDLVL